MEVTAAMLADAAVVADGKLYVHGGGWDRLLAAEVPARHARMALVLLFRFEWSVREQVREIVIEMLDEDDHPAGVRGEGTVEVGTSPAARPGDPIFVPYCIVFEGLEFPAYASYRFRVTSDGEELASVPIHVGPMPVAP